MTFRNGSEIVAEMPSQQECPAPDIRTDGQLRHPLSRKTSAGRTDIWNQYATDRSVIDKTLTKAQFEFEPENYDANQ